MKYRSKGGRFRKKEDFARLYVVSEEKYNELAGYIDHLLESDYQSNITLKYLAEKVKEKYGVKEAFIYYVGAVIGSHSGPGTLALFFLGEHR